jgi:3-hydroxyacyl-[acyl-carrier-protein] dehydratase
MTNNEILHAKLYDVVEKSDTLISVQLADASHPVFQAHFPGNPLLPAFMQLDIIAAVIDKEIDAVVTAKFVKPVLPETTLQYTIKEGSKSDRIIVKDGEGSTVCDAKVRWHDI